MFDSESPPCNLSHCSISASYKEAAKCCPKCFILPHLCLHPFISRYFFVHTVPAYAKVETQSRTWPSRNHSPVSGLFMRLAGRRPFEPRLKRRPHPAASALPPVTTQLQVEEAGNPRYPLKSSPGSLVGSKKPYQ